MYRIAVIDDDAAIRKMLQMSLSPEGYECLLAPNAALGKTLCLEERPDLILLDVHLPDDNGIELCRKLKADDRLRHIPVLLLTGAASEIENRMAGLEAGADDYILKPFNTKELLSRIKRLIRSATRPTQSA